MIQLSNIPGIVLSPPAPRVDLNSLELRLGKTLPKEYCEILMLSNGFSIGGGLLLYSTDEFEERNATWEVELYAPGYIAIGDTGGGDVILVSDSENTSGVFVVGSGSMDPSDMRQIADNLEDWVSKNCSTRKP